MDKDGDYYEQDFIDDSEYTPRARRSAQKRKRKKERELWRVHKKVGMVNYSSEEEEEEEGCEKRGQEDAGCYEGPSRGGRSVRKHLFSSESEGDGESEEDGGSVFVSKVKRRKKARWNSDEEVDHTPLRFATLNSSCKELI